MVHTPGGVRCRECAQLRRPVMYELAIRDYVFAALAADATALPLGVVGGLLLPTAASTSIFAIVLALLAGSGAGSAVAAVIAWATNRKRGLALQLIAAAALVLAALIRLIVAGGLDQATRDVVGIFTLVIAIAVSWGRLR